LEQILLLVLSLEFDHVYFCVIESRPEAALVCTHKAVIMRVDKANGLV
jgi:hypothetical protein